MTDTQKMCEYATCAVRVIFFRHWRTGKGIKGIKGIKRNKKETCRSKTVLSRGKRFVIEYKMLCPVINL